MNSTHHDAEQDHPPGHPFWCVPSILLAIVVMASPLMIGGVHAITASLVAAVSLVGFWWTLKTPHSPSPQTPTVALSIPTLAFGLMALFCLIQLLPLPTFLYRLVQPSGYGDLIANWDAAFTGGPPGWHMISVDPAATAEHALKWIALSATCALAAQVIVGRERRRQWLGLILITGGVVALVGTIQHLSGTDKILGIYTAELSPRSISAFVNTNHAASYFGVMVIIGVSYALDHLRRSPLRSTMGVGAATVALFLCAAHGSDGALVALAAGLAVLGIAVAVRTTPELSTQKRWIRPVILVILLAGVIAAAFVPESWTLADEEDQIFAGTSADARIQMTTAALHGSMDYPVMGSGAGSVERVLPPYLDWHRFGYSSVPTVENEPAEWVLTMGPMVALVALMIFLFLMRHTAPHVIQKHGRRGPVYACALLLFIGVVSLFHFPFFTLGISIVVAVAVEGCLHQKHGGLHLHRSKKAALLFALALTVSLGGLWGARATVLAEGPEETLDVSDREEVRRAMHLYPTDGVLLTALSLQARGEDPERALALARRAFMLRPHPQQEFLLARTLAISGNFEESAEVYRELLREDRRSVGLYNQIQPRLRRDLRDSEFRARAYSEASAGRLNVFARYLLSEEGPTAALDFGLALVEERPDRAEAHLLIIDLYRRADQVELAEMYARALVARNLVGPDNRRPAGLAELLDIMKEEDRSHEGRTLADRAFSSGLETPEFARSVFELRPDNPRDLTDRDLRLFTAAVEIGCRPPYEQSYRARCWIARAYMAEAAGNLEEAQSLLERVERHHDDPRELGAFFARQGECQQLAGVQRRNRGGRYIRNLERQTPICARYEIGESTTSQDADP